MAEMKGIKLCGECINYDWKKHKCKIGCNDDSNAQAPFYGDCPLPDVAPKSDAEKQKLEIWRLQGEVERLKAEKDALIKNYAECMKDYAREIFTEIEFDIHNLDFDREETRAIAIEGIIANAKKRYTEEGNEV